jgi:hypothetical protein
MTHMSEAPRRDRHEGSQLDIAQEVRAEAAKYLEDNAELRESVLGCNSAVEVREKILSHFEFPTELNQDPSPVLSEVQKAVLAEAVTRWNTQRIADSQ